jgi:hypothetical protein
VVTIAPASTNSIFATNAIAGVKPAVGTNIIAGTNTALASSNSPTSSITRRWRSAKLRSEVLRGSRRARRDAPYLFTGDHIVAVSQCPRGISYSVSGLASNWATRARRRPAAPPSRTR